MASSKKYQDMTIGLDASDRLKIAELARLEGKTKTEVARDALRWYLENYEQIKGQGRESEVAQAMRYATDQHVKAIKSGVDRVCKMLSRQGSAIGTLYELSWLALPDDENARAAFEAASNTAKQKMRKHLDKDENELAASFKKMVESP